MSEAGAPYREPEQPRVADHTGANRPDAVFWSPADPKIGPLLSAWSNQDKSGFRNTSNVVRQRVILGVMVGGFGALLVAGIFSAFGVVAGLVAAVAAAAGTAALLFFEFRVRPWCSYIGEDGMSEHRVMARGPRHRLLRFADATALFIARTDHIENGFYRHTVVEYSWRDAAGGVLLSDKLITVERGVAAAGARLGARLAGRTGGEDPLGTWLMAGKRRWSELRQARIDAELAEHQSATFPLLGGGSLTVRRGAIEVITPKDRRTLAAGEAGEASWKEGVLTIQRQGGRGKDGIHLRAGDVGDLAIALATMRGVGGIDAGIPDQNA